MWGACKAKVHEFPNFYFNGFINVHDAEESLHSYQGIMGLGYQLTQAVDNSVSQQPDMDVNRINTLIRLTVDLVCFICIMWVVTLVLELLV